jgi:hypothetical protein
MRVASLRFGGKVLAAALIGALALPVSVLALDSDAKAARKAHRSEGLVITNARIYTVDAKDQGEARVVDEVLIKNGRFAEVGKNVDRSQHVRVVDAGGRVVIPGIIDPHTHIVLVGNRPGWHTPMEHVFTIPDAIVEYQVRAMELDAAGVPSDQFITTIGPIAARQFAENRLPTIQELDSVSLTRPVYVQAAQGGIRANTAARNWFAANNPAVTVNPDTGAVSGPALQTLRIAFLTPETRKRTAHNALQYYTGLGITTHGDSGAFHAETPSNGIASENTYTMHFPFLALNREKNMPARLRIDFLHRDPPSDPTLTLAERLRNSFPYFGDDWLRTRGIGEFTGGTLEALLAVGRAGWRGEDHSLSLNNFLGLVALRQQAHDQLIAEDFPDGISKLRWVISHVPGTTEDSVNQWKALGGGLLVGWGPLRAGTNVGPAYRTLFDNGIPLGYHADGGDITVINPWMNFYTMITGRNLTGDLVNEGQTLTRWETLWLATAANKWFVSEDDLGSIEVGNHGDLVVLDRDFFNIPDAEIPRVRSVFTVIGGKIMHDAGVVRHKHGDD